MKSKKNLIASCAPDGTLEQSAECIEIMQSAEGHDSPASADSSGMPEIPQTTAVDKIDSSDGGAPEVAEGYISLSESARREHEAWLRGRNEKIEAEWLNPDLLERCGRSLSGDIPPGLFSTRPSVWE